MEDHGVSEELYNYGLEVFNNENEKFGRWLEKNKNKTEKELKQLLDNLEYGIFL